MAQDPWTHGGDAPRREPEIIPPGADDPWRGGETLDPAFGRGGARMFHIRRIGPFGLVLALLIILIVLAALVLLFAGALLLWLPLVAIAVAGSVVAAVFRRFLGPR